MDKQEQVLMGLVVVVGVLLGGMLLMKHFRPQSSLVPVVETVVPQTVSLKRPRKKRVAKVWIQFSGAVKYPGLYQVTANQRVRTAVLAAGGTVSGADLERVNWVSKLRDGKKITVPYQKGWKKRLSGTKTRKKNSIKPVFPISINQSGFDAWVTVPGIGPKMAQKIIAYRQKNGFFFQVEDLKKVSGIGEKSFAKMRGYLGL